MRSRISARSSSAYFAALLTFVLVIASTTAVDARKPPKPPPTSPPAPTAALGLGLRDASSSLHGHPGAERRVRQRRRDGHLPGRLDVQIGGPKHPPGEPGRLRDVQRDLHGNATGRPLEGRQRQSVHARRLDRHRLLTITRNGQQVQATRTDDQARAGRHRRGSRTRASSPARPAAAPGIAVAVACPIGATGQQSSVTVTQGSAQRTASFTPICDRRRAPSSSRSPASQGTFHTGSAERQRVRLGRAGTAGRSPGPTTGRSRSSSRRPVTRRRPTTPPGLWAERFGDTETWLRWGASTDNATPTGLIVYEVFLNGRFDQPIGGGQTQAILYADLGVLNTIEVFAVDGAGNRSAPASVTVDFRF